MTGTWRTYEAGEAGRRASARAVLVLELDGLIAACFDAPVVELFDTRAESIHPVLRRLGPDLLDEAFDATAALERLRDPAQAGTTIAEAILDQRLMAGVGNVFRSEILFIERVDPFATVGSLDDRRSSESSRRPSGSSSSTSSPASAAGGSTTGGVRAAGGQDLWVYNLAGRPCRRCGTAIRVASLGRELPRSVWWCPHCQAPGSPGQRVRTRTRLRTPPCPSISTRRGGADAGPDDCLGRNHHDVRRADRPISRPRSADPSASAGPRQAARSASSIVNASPSPNAGVPAGHSGEVRFIARAIPGQGSIGSTGASVPKASVAPARSSDCQA